MSLFPMFAPVSASVTEVTYGSEAFDGTDLNNSPSFSSMTFGSAAANRYVFAAIGCGDSMGSGGTTAVTIGGVSATLSAQSFGADGGTGIHTSIWIANVPTGTTGTVAITQTANAHGTGVSTFYAYGVDPTASDTATVANVSTTSLNASIDIPGGGFVICSCHSAYGTVTHTWTNATETSDDYGDASQGGVRSTAADNEAAAVSGRSITCARTGSAYNMTMAIASFAAA